MIKKNIQHLLISCLALSLIRMKISESLFLAFLIWNLFLAAIPFYISNYLEEQGFRKISNLKFIVALGFWLLFLPNAPYIITDFIHLRNPKSAFVWFDILLLFTYANTGFILAVVSINQIFQIIQQKWSLKLAHIFLVIVTFSCGFGIYLGRILRFNSWDIFSSPFYVLKTSVLGFSDKNAWLMTFGFGSLLYLATKFFRGFSFSSTKSCK